MVIVLFHHLLRSFTFFYSYSFAKTHSSSSFSSSSFLAFLFISPSSFIRVLKQNSSGRAEPYMCLAVSSLNPAATCPIKVLRFIYLLAPFHFQFISLSSGTSSSGMYKHERPLSSNSRLFNFNCSSSNPYRITNHISPFPFRIMQKGSKFQ